MFDFVSMVSSYGQGLDVFSRSSQCERIESAMNAKDFREDLFISLMLPTGFFSLFALLTPLTVFGPSSAGEIIQQLENLFWIEVQILKMALLLLVFRSLPFGFAYFLCFALMVGMLRLSPPPGDPGPATFFLLPTMPLVPYGFERLSSEVAAYLDPQNRTEHIHRVELFVRGMWIFFVLCQLLLRLKLDLGYTE